jgi:AraC family transcriptional regulator of adaptative response / DNA-3-methyladenine glycosylase II
MILAGEIDQEPENHLAVKLGVSSRHLRRLFVTHLGVTPTHLARSSRAHFARRLIDDTDLAVIGIASAAGFGSVRQMNRVFKEIFRCTPTEARAKRKERPEYLPDGGLRLELPYDGSFDWESTMSLVAATAIPGVEHVSPDQYARVVTIHGDPGVIELRPADGEHLVLIAHLPHWEGLIHIVRRVMGLAGLNSPTEEGLDLLRGDPMMERLVTKAPGTRVPGAWDPLEAAIPAVIGEGIDTRDASEIIARMVRRLGKRVPGMERLRLSHAFPHPARLAEGDLTGLGIPPDRQRTISAVAGAIAWKEIPVEPLASAQDLADALKRAADVSDWVAETVAMKLGDRDAFPADQVVADTFRRIQEGDGSLESASEKWRPWRSLAVQHLVAESLRENSTFTPRSPRSPEPWDGREAASS